jgi:hypothetical protein
VNTWEFVISEIKRFSQNVDFIEPQEAREDFIENQLLFGYNITKSKDQVYTA